MKVHSIQRKQATGMFNWAGVLAGVCLGWGALWAPALAGPVSVEVLDGAGKPLSDAVVFLESPEAARAVKPMSGVNIAQEGRTFVPRVQVVTRGTEVGFPNRDTVRHHVYSFSPAKKFEIKLYAGSPANPVLFDQPGVVVLGCNIHDQMVGWVLVMSTPYFTASRAGKATLADVPAGNYRLKVWHEGLPVGAPALEQALVVPAAGAVAASIRVTGLAL